MLFGSMVIPTDDYGGPSLSVPSFGEDAIVLRAGSNVIGRTEGADIVVDHRSLSRRHATIEITEHSAVIVDMGSANGVIVNGRQVDKAILDDGAAILLGSVPFIFRRKGDACALERTSEQEAVQASQRNTANSGARLLAFIAGVVLAAVAVGVLVYVISFG